MMLRDVEVVRTALVAATMARARAVGYAQTLQTLLIQQFAEMADDEVELIAKELGI